MTIIDYLCGGIIVFLFLAWLLYATTCWPNRHKWVLDSAEDGWYHEHCTKCDERRDRNPETKETITTKIVSWTER